MKYKVGDKVRVRKDLVDGKFYGENNFSDTDKKLCGKICTIEGVGYDFYNLEEEGDNPETLWTDEMLEPAIKTLEDLEVGDKVKLSGFDSVCTVLAVCGKLIALTDGEDSDHFNDDWYTVQELKEYGYKVVNEEGEEETIVTMNEVADKFGVSVDKLKIKKE